MADATEARYPLRVAVRRTGLKPDLIRAWERRYEAVLPARSPANQRLYSDADIRRLQYLQQAVEAGEAISQVARLSDDRLRELYGSEVRPDRLTVSGEDQSQRASLAADYLQQCIDAIEVLDGSVLKGTLDEAVITLGRIGLLDDLLVPLLERIGTLYYRGRLRIAHEHFATANLRMFVEGLQPAFPPDASAPTLVVATPARQMHELGALLASVSARIEGWRVVYLGANLPAEEIAAAVRSSGAIAVALSLTWPGDDPNLADELRLIRRSTAAELLVGGQTSSTYRTVLDEIDARVTGSLAELRETLESLRSGAQKQEGSDDEN